MITNAKFLSNKVRFGPYWGLYITGIESLWDFKFTIISLMGSLIIDMSTTYLLKQTILTNHQIDSNDLLFSIIYIISGKIIKSGISVITFRKILNERVTIGKRITRYIDSLYKTASNSWQNKNSNTSQKESIRELFFAYEHVTMSLSIITQTFIDTIVISVVAFTDDISVPIVVIVGTYVLYLMRQYFGSESKKMTSIMAEKNTNCQLLVSNQFANRSDLNYNPSYALLQKPEVSDPVEGLLLTFKVWDDRNSLENSSKQLTDMAHNLIIMLYSVYLWKKNKFELITFILINSNRLFGLLEIYSNLETTQNLSISRLASSFIMIDEIFPQDSRDSVTIRVSRVSPVSRVSKSTHKNDIIDKRSKANPTDSLDKEDLNPLINESKLVDHNIMDRVHQKDRQTDGLSKIDQYEINELDELDEFNSEINSIEFNNLYYKINEKIILEYKGLVRINLMDGKIILLNGQKGCGKSLTMDFLGGRYDGKVTSSMKINGIELKEEFRTIKKYRTYVRQCVVDEYKSNKKNTITMSLSELFPRVKSIVELKEFLVNFELVNKIPNDLISPVSKDERGLSPGETQSLVLASQIWRAMKINSKILLLDEPERNIDFETVRKIFDNVLINYKYTIILITHLGELKEMLRKNLRIKEIWNYKPNDGGPLSFEIQRI